MKLNKKGFMLAEVVIVATVISTVLVAMYISLNRISSAYELRNRYYDIDAMYAAMEINDILDDSFNVVEDYTMIDNTNGFINFYNNNSSINNTIMAYYVKSDSLLLEKLNDSLNDNKIYLKDYIEYLEDNIIFDDYDYLIIVELTNKTNSDDTHYYTLKVKGDSNETQ